MKVAVIGAGVSGLSAAISLEKYGIIPDVFEIKPKVGELFNHVAGLLHVINRPINDPLKYLDNTFGIRIAPLNVLNKIIMHGPTVTATVKSSKLGYMFLRGQGTSSVENQMYEKLTASVNFNVNADYKKLKIEYDYVIVATGNHQIAKETGCWQELISTWVRVANVIGKFDTNALIMWVNTLYCKSGYVYLVPFNENRAVLVMIVPYITKDELQHYWDAFLKIEKIDMDIVNTVDLQHTSGNCFPHRYENLFFIGNAGGAIEPFLGFGMFNSVISGALAAKSIIRSSDFEKEMISLTNANMKMLEFRKAFDLMNNDKFDKLIRLLAFPPVKKLVYDTNFNVIKYGSLITKYTSNKMHNKPYKNRKKV